MKNSIISFCLCFLLSFAQASSALDGNNNIKISLVGGAGKSSLVERFVKEKFDQNACVTIGIDFAGKEIIIDDASYKLNLWFSSTQKRFRRMQLETLHSAHVVLIATDLSEPEPTEELEFWLEAAKKYAHKNCAIIVVGTKGDLVFAADTTHAPTKNFCELNNVPYFETSAKNDTNVTDLFVFAAQKAKNL